VFKEVGPVQDFRLVFDRDTGKPKGYGFVTFAGETFYTILYSVLISSRLETKRDPLLTTLLFLPDIETASSALRNLNGFELGGRPLRVDYAEHEAQGYTDDWRRVAQSQPAPNVPAPQPVGQSTSEPAIANVIASSTGPQLVSILSQMKVCRPRFFCRNYKSPSCSNVEIIFLIVLIKTLVQGNPDQARTLLMANPQLAYALFQAMLVSNVVDHGVLQVQRQQKSILCLIAMVRILSYIL
jgi:cleavage stimulation factor subunit 2